MANYIEALKRLPPHRIELIELAWRFAKPDGSLDEDLMSLNMKEIQDAAKAATAYAEDTKKAVTLLWQLLHLQP
jgi:hypothetical protein